MRRLTIHTCSTSFEHLTRSYVATHFSYGGILGQVWVSSTGNLSHEWLFARFCELTCVTCCFCSFWVDTNSDFWFCSHVSITSPRTSHLTLKSALECDWCGSVSCSCLWRWFVPSSVSHIFSLVNKLLKLSQSLILINWCSCLYDLLSRLSNKVW